METKTRTVKYVKKDGTISEYIIHTQGKKKPEYLEDPKILAEVDRLMSCGVAKTAISRLVGISPYKLEAVIAKNVSMKLAKKAEEDKTKDEKTENAAKL